MPRQDLHSDRIAGLNSPALPAQEKAKEDGWAGPSVTSWLNFISVVRLLQKWGMR